MNVNVQIPAGLLARMQSFADSGARSPVNLLRVMGEAVKEKTRDHLAALAASRHTTANRLGATPTGHLEEAARAVEDAPLTADVASASFVINHPGLSRAFHDVHIVPTGGKQFLTIPLNAIAYGRRAGEFAKVVFNPGPGNVPQDIAAYLLVRSVTQKQDRSLLPSDSEWKEAAIDAAEALVRTA